jgi:adenosylcobinamide amidohydrolase
VAPGAAVDWTVAAGDRQLVVRFGAPVEVASWAIWNGGRRRARAVAWLAVNNAELPVGVDPRRLCGERLRAAALEDAVGLLTSGRLDRFRRASAVHDGVTCHALATVGLSNAVRVGDPPGALAPVGTINLLCAVSAPLTEEAALEAMSIAIEARTAAVIEGGHRSRRSAGVATGTGTDCLVLAWPGREAAGQAPAPFAGKHTALGHVIGQAVFGCVQAGVKGWLEAVACAAG